MPTLLASIILLSFIVSGAPAPTINSQDASPTDDAALYRVALVPGSCEDQSDTSAISGSVISLGDVVDVEVLGTPVADSTYQNRSVFVVSGSAPFGFDELSVQAYSVEVWYGHSDDQTLMACGDIAGAIVDGQLTVGVYNVEDDSLIGIAIVETATRSQISVSQTTGVPEIEEASTPEAPQQDSSEEAIDSGSPQLWFVVYLLPSSSASGTPSA